jgi:hypothetical protein
MTATWGRPPFYFPPEAALPREPAIADQGDGPEDCDVCHGDGGWTETIEDGTGRGIEVDTLCNFCGGSGVL